MGSHVETLARLAGAGPGITPKHCLRFACRSASDTYLERFVAVVIRMKKMGRAHQAFFRVCAFDKRAPRGGRPLEELGTYDPRVPETDARAVLKKDRVDYWLGVGAQPSVKVRVLIKK